LFSGNDEVKPSEDPDEAKENVKPEEKEPEENEAPKDKDTAADDDDTKEAGELVSHYYCLSSQW